MKKYTLSILSILLTFFCNTQTESFQYKQLHNSDLPVFQEFCNKAFKGYITSDEDKDFLNGWTIEKYLLYIANRTKYSTYIHACYQKDECIGFQVLRLNPTQNECPDADYIYDPTNSEQREYKYGFIECTFVKPEYRKQGIASKFITMSEKECLKQGYLYIIRIGKSYNNATENMYRKFNFKQLDPLKRTLWTKYLQTREQIENNVIVVFEKHLSNQNLLP